MRAKSSEGKMKTYIVQTEGSDVRLKIVERDRPTPGPGEVLVHLGAMSLNYHDMAVIRGDIPTADGRVPMSDGAGTVLAIGAGVTQWREGDRVLSTFFPDWADGTINIAKRRNVTGDTIDGVAAEYIVLPEKGVTRQPEGWSHAEASTLPCAALTAWRAVVVEGKVKPGDWVLVQGTGGVSVFALQFARAAGARVVATSSSDKKLEAMRDLGAEICINYRSTPKWGAEAANLTGGIDQIVEVGGPETLKESIKAARLGGHITMIGVLTGIKGEVPTAMFFQKNLHMTGVSVGSHAMQLDMIRAIEANDLRPVIDREFSFAELNEAFDHQADQAHLGKIIVKGIED
ncbi:NAD(P)-dependent alcohol dehydrogenase [Sulfitobacter sp. F26169L]|uniref:zinc-dependent alcohol dehydrogenase family protein n=1 Tax=Sulfitobacter sp. F26169L TaxID=2996015 RepID=UPI002260A450|nr:NAD(P)-dependent alcohol dehydrogenase [Sulfitobacter sp. F26169L]MCX7567906.1 NAD(P)-dependent alcohol dehydrogenase [Sulfitobacter sp. F26169L]